MSSTTSSNTSFKPSFPPATKRALAMTAAVGSSKASPVKKRIYIQCVLRFHVRHSMYANKQGYAAGEERGDSQQLWLSHSGNRGSVQAAQATGSVYLFFPI